MGSSEAGPMEFNHGNEILPLMATGISSLGEFQHREAELKGHEQLKRCGLSEEEIRLYRESEAAVDRTKMESSALKEKLQHIYSKLESARSGTSNDNTKPSTSEHTTENNLPEKKSTTFYPDQHPMNSIKDLEKEMFDHITGDKIDPIAKRRKVLRRLLKKQQCLEFDSSKVGIKHIPISSAEPNPNSLWDVKEVPKNFPPVPRVEIIRPKNKKHKLTGNDDEKRIIGPKQQARYTIKDKKIVRLEAVGDGAQEYRAVDIVVPVNQAEERLLDGTKLSIDQIHSMERFKHYQPGNPSKVLFLKNISPAASDEDISILFNQFLHENQAPIHIRLMGGRLRGQAFVHFQHENVAIQALEDINGTVLKGRPIIAQFGKNRTDMQH